MSELFKVQFGLLFYLYVTFGMTISYLKYKYSYDFRAIHIRGRCVC